MWVGMPGRTGASKISSASSPAPGLGDLAAGQAQDLLHARLDDLAQDLARDLPGPAPAHAGHADHVVAGQVPRRRHAELLLDALGLLERRAQPHGDVVGHVVAAQPQHRGVLDRPVGEHGDVRGSAADIDQTHAQLTFVEG
jgi:hypothetical protein